MLVGALQPLYPASTLLPAAEAGVELPALLPGPPRAAPTATPEPARTWKLLLIVTHLSLEQQSLSQICYHLIGKSNTREAEVGGGRSEGNKEGGRI